MMRFGAAGTVGTLVAVALVAGPAALPAQAAPQVFAYTGTPQLYVVPEAVTSINFTLDGAQGGTSSGGGTGGLGSQVSGTLTVTPGQVLQLNVGGLGQTFSGGFNGGGKYGGGGGGASDIRVGDCAITLNCGNATRHAVAGGGGGGGTLAGSDGGAAGDATGATGIASAGGSTGGSGGTAVSGGAAGTGNTGGAAGQLASGGQGGLDVATAGGGGGGGYYGGGGGGATSGTTASGGGGGSSLVPAGGSYVGPAPAGAGTITISETSAVVGASFALTGAPGTYTVAPGVSAVRAQLFGAAGNISSSANSGFGAGAVGDGPIVVTGGEQLEVRVGGAGATLAGGYNGGGAGTGDAASGGGGGGATDIRRCASIGSCALTDRIVVVGGGGGGGGSAYGGSGGSPVGAPGQGGSAGDGLGGTQSAGGAAGQGGSATAGALGLGGDGTTGSPGGGGGGGGYYGGGGGFYYAGGGGSSLAPPNYSIGTFGGNLGDGFALLTANPSATTEAATNVTGSSADLPGLVNAQYFTTTPTIKFDTDQSVVAGGGGTSATVAPTGPFAGASDHAVSASLSSLTNGATYYYRVCGVSLSGMGCGSVLSFTAQDPPPAPTATGVSPNSGPLAGGTTVTVTGTNLDGTTAVTVGGNPCTPVVVAGDGLSLTCTLPSGTAGNQTVTVTTPGGSADATGGYTYVADSIQPQVVVSGGVVVPRAIPVRGRVTLLKAHTVTNAGQRVRVKVTCKERLRGDMTLCRIIRKKNGAVFLKTYGYRLKVRVSWYAPAETGYAAYSKIRKYRS